MVTGTGYMTDSRLAIDITHTDGTHSRWGPDEPNGRDVPNDLTLTTSMPGGDESMSCSLKRNLRLYQDENVLDDCMVYGPGGESVWNGRMSDFPADGETVTASAVGWVDHMRDDTTAREIFVHRDMSAWGDMSASRLNAISSSSDTASPVQTSDPDNNYNPVISIGIEGVWPRPKFCETWFDASGIPIGLIQYAWKRDNSGSVSPADSLWTWGLALSKDSMWGGYDYTGELRAAGPGIGIGYASTLDRTWAVFQLGYKSGGGGGTIYRIELTNLTVFGAQGLAGYGVQDATNGQGLLVSDIVANIVKRWCPLLNYTSPGSIEPTTFVVPHFAPMDAQTPYDMHSLVNGFELKQWGVYSGGEDGYPRRTFFFREPRPERLTWQARRSDGAKLTNEGVQAADLVNGVVVTFTTPDKSSHTVGPPGSGCQYTDASLLDTDINNPVNAHGIPRKYGKLNVSTVTTPAGATQLGHIWLTRRLGVQRRGTLALVGSVRHPSGVMAPTWRVRSGDYVQVMDDPRDTEPRQIIHTNYTHGNRAVVCDLEHDAFRIDAQMAKMGVEVVGIE